jgi:membrane-bound lytic murein transglycosylase D
MTKYKQIKKITAAFLFAFGCQAFMPQQSLAQEVVDEKNEVVMEPADTVNQVENFVVEYNDSVYPVKDATSYSSKLDESFYAGIITELSKETPLELTYNTYVQGFIDMYIYRKRDQVSRMLGLAQIYFPIFEEVMRNNEMPEDIKYLAVIESALNPNAVSRAGAVGMWQFMYGTAKLYNLKVNKEIDERKDIYKSTMAAAAYLKNSYNRYGNWMLALASYNCGPGNVDKAIYRSGGKKDFWEIINYLPRETRGYVPAFIAAMYVMNYYYHHDLYPVYPDNKFCEIVCVPITEKICFNKIAQYTNYSVDDLKFLNPGLNSNVIPVWDDEPYALKMPAEMLPIYDAMRDSIVSSSKYVVPTYHHYTTYASGKSGVHVVRRGETLGGIASKYHTTVTNIKRWNNLRSNTIYVGQKIKLYGTAANRTNTVSSNSGSTTTTTTNTGQSSGTVIYYKVKPGDTLYGIARKYKGLTIDEIRASNGASKTTNLKAGTVLKLVL